MADFILIETGIANAADGSPSGCLLCGSVDGPFVKIANIAAVPAGPIKEGRTELQFCAPRRDPSSDNIVLREGCAGRIAGLIGYLGPDVLEGAQVSLTEQITLNGELQDEIAKLRESQVNVIPVDELMKLIDASKPVTKKT